MSKFCRECGNEIKDGAKFCAKCGEAIGNSSTEKVVTTEVSSKKIQTSNKRITNKLLCKLTAWPWVITLILAFLLLYAGEGFEIFLGTLAFIGGSMVLIFGIWGLVRLARAKHRVATIIAVLTIVVLIFQKVEIISNLGRIGLFISIIIGLIELNKLPNNIVN